MVESKALPKYTAKQKRMLRFLAAVHKVTVEEMELIIVCERLDELQADFDVVRDNVVAFPAVGSVDFT